MFFQIIHQNSIIFRYLEIILTGQILAKTYIFLQHESHGFASQVYQLTYEQINISVKQMNANHILPMHCTGWHGDFRNETSDKFFFCWCHNRKNFLHRKTRKECTRSHLTWQGGIFSRFKPQIRDHTRTVEALVVVMVKWHYSQKDSERKLGRRPRIHTSTGEIVQFSLHDRVCSLGKEYIKSL